jgi:hypothetical protein
VNAERVAREGDPFEDAVATPNVGSERTAGGGYDRAAKLRKPAHVRLDRFGIFAVGREHALTALDRWLLTSLVLLCDFRTGEYLTTLAELSEDTGADWRALKDSVKRLETAGLVQLLVPFSQKSKGTLRVLAYDRLVVGAKSVVPAAPRESDAAHVRARPRRKTAEPRYSTDTNPDTNPAPIPRQFDANPATKPRDREIAPLATSENADAQGNKRTREQGFSHDSRGDGDGVHIGDDGSFGDGYWLAVARAKEVRLRRQPETAAS